MLTADDVLRARFTVTAFRPGYDMAEVDAFLDRAVRTLRDRDAGEPGRAEVTAQDVADLRLRTRTFRQGYEMAQVDELLDRLRTTLVSPPAPPGPVRDAPRRRPDAPHHVRLREVVSHVVVGLPPQRPPRTVAPRRAARVRARWVQVTADGVTWDPPLRRGGHLDAAHVAEVVKLVLSYPRGGSVTYYLVIDQDGAVRIRVHEWWRTPTRRMWTPLRPRTQVTTAPVRYDRAKDARRTWPEAFTWFHAYPLLTGLGLLAVYMGVVVPVLTVLGVE